MIHPRYSFIFLFAERDRGRQRETERDRERQRETERDRERQRDIERQRGDRQTDRDTNEKDNHEECASWESK